MNCSEHGTVTPGTAEYADGTEVTLIVTPDSGYRVKSVTLDGTPVDLTDGKYTFTVTANCTFEATFEAIPADRYTVTVNCGEHGTVMPGTAEYADGTEVTLTVTPDSGYRVKSVTLDGDPVDLTDGRYTFTVTANCTFEAVFQKISVSTGGSSGGHSGVSSKPAGSSSRPSINGVEKDWSDIAADISGLPAESSIVISLNGSYTVPAEVIRSISGSRVKAEFIVDSYRSWLVDGAELITAAAADMTLLPGTADKSPLRGVPGTNVRTFLTGVPAELRLKFRREFAGQFANVYRVKDKELIFQCCARVDSDGSVNISGVYPGEYVVMVCEYSDVPGDVNNDGTLNALDAAELLKHIIGISGGANVMFADFNGDGAINALDASSILRSVIGL